MIGRMWGGKNKLVLRDSESGRTFDLYIMGAGLLDPIELEEIILGEEEIFAADCKIPRPAKAPLSRGDQRDFGKLLAEIQGSKRERRQTSNVKYIQKD